MKRYFLFILIGLGSAIYSENSTIEDCIKIEENEKRLACFDLVTQAAVENIKKPEVAIPIKTQRKTIAQKLKDQVKDFGLTKKQKKEVLEITSKISRLKLLNSYNLLVVLENGQTWRSVEKIRRVRMKEGQTVKISEGLVSGYSLKVVDKKIAIRVKRIK
jgi:transcription antitermination factor NusG